eukprot:jgi/Botrbrau1/2321/Bobra.39_1s0010.1
MVMVVMTSAGMVAAVTLGWGLGLYGGVTGILLWSLRGGWVCLGPWASVHCRLLKSARPWFQQWYSWLGGQVRTHRHTLTQTQTHVRALGAVWDCTAGLMLGWGTRLCSLYAAGL